MNKRITKTDIVRLILSNKSEEALSLYKKEIAPILEKIYLLSNNSEELAVYYDELIELYVSENNKV